MKIKPYKKFGRRIAIIGASSKTHRFSYKAVRAFTEEGYDVFPVNPSYEKILGLRVYDTVDEIPGGVNIVSLYRNRDKQEPELAEQIKKSKASLVIFNPGTENEDIEAKIRNHDIEVREECSIVGLGRYQSEF